MDNNGLKSIENQIYIQGNKLGLASYHFGEFDGKQNHFISYLNAYPTWKLSNGEKPDEKKYFIDPKYSPEERSFEGIIDWRPNTFSGSSIWIYKMIFSNDF